MTESRGRVPDRGGRRRHVHGRGVRARRAPAPRVQGPEHAREPRRGGARRGGTPRGGRGRARLPHAARARHDGGDQRGAGAKGRPARDHHHRGVPRHPRDRAPDATRDVRDPARPPDPGVPRAARHADRGEGADRPGGRGHRTARRSVGARHPRSARRRRSRVHRGVPPLLVRQPGARTPGAGDRARRTPGARDLALERGRPRVPRVRADRGHRLRRLHQADGGPLPRRSGATAGRCGSAGTTAGDAVTRGTRARRHRPRPPGTPIPLRAGGRRHWRSGDRGGGRPRRRHHPGRGRHELRHRARLRRQAPHPQRGRHRRVSGSGADGGRERDRRGRRKHRLDRRRRRAAGRPPVRRLGPRARLLRSRRPRADGHGRVHRARLPRPEMVRGRRHRSRRGPGAGRDRRAHRRAARTRHRGRGGRHPPGRQRTDGGRHPPRLGSPGVRSARVHPGRDGRGGARFTRARSPPTSPSRGWWCLAIPACCPRPGSLPRRSSTRCQPRMRSLWRGSPWRRCGASSPISTRSAGSSWSARGSPPDEDVDILHFADVCHIGQGYHLEVPFNPGADDALERLYADFLAAHERVHGHAVDAPARFVNLRAVHRQRLPQAADTPARGATGAAPGAGPNPGGTDSGVRRMVRFPDEPAPIETRIVARDSLAAGDRLGGPAVVEQDDTTTLIPPAGRHGPATAESSPSLRTTTPHPAHASTDHPDGLDRSHASDHRTPLPPVDHPCRSASARRRPVGQSSHARSGPIGKAHHAVRAPARDRARDRAIASAEGSVITSG